jgi:ATP-dependent RNA helicase DeaD
MLLLFKPLFWFLRELGHQILKFRAICYIHSKYFHRSNLRRNPHKIQIERLALPTHIVVATPGRLIDLIQRKTINKETKFSD